MTNDEARALLRECADRLMSCYPLPDDSAIDARLALTLGFAAGVICEGLQAAAEDRDPWWFGSGAWRDAAAR